MSQLRWTLNNTVSGALVLTYDPKGWENVELTLERDPEWHGVFREFAIDLQFYCDGGGKEYIDNIYETQGIDALVTLLIEYSCGDGTFETLFSGKLNLATYMETNVDGFEYVTQCAIERNDITQTIRDRRNIKINLNDLTTLDGTAMNAYTNAPASINAGSQTIDLLSEIDGGVFVDNNPFDGVARPQFTIAITEQIYFQSAMPVIEDDLTQIGPNPDFHNKSATPTTVIEPNLVPFYDSEENNVIEFPESYAVSWDIAGNYTDTITTGAQTRTLAAQLSLFLVYGQDYTTAQADGQVITIGFVPGYTTALAAYGPIPFAFLGGAPITLNRGDKIWLCWESAGGTGYVVTTGTPLSVHSVTFGFSYIACELTLAVASSVTPGSDSGFGLYEAWARVSESITDQVSYAFKSDFFGRTDSEPSAGSAPTYGSDGCGSLTFLFSGLALRGYGKHKLESPLPDFTTLDELFKGCEAVWNIGLGVEQHSGQDVIRVEEKEYFYDNNSLIQLSNVKNIEMMAAQDHYINRVEIGYEQWEPEQFNGLDEICTRHEYDLPIKTVENALVKRSPIIASGYAIEVQKRNTLTQGKDKKYDNNNFFLAVKRVLMTFAADDDADFSATAGIANPTTRRNMKLTPKRNLLRWMNIIGSSVQVVAATGARFRSGEGNFYFTTTVDPVGGYFGCNGDYSGMLLDADGDIDWDDANLRLDPLFILEIYEFDAPLTYAQYKTVRDNAIRYVEFRPDSTSAFISGWILRVDYKLNGGLTHFTLIRRYTP